MKLLLFSALLALSLGYPEQGKFVQELNPSNHHTIGFSKTMFNGTTISIDITSICGNSHDRKYVLTWLTVYADCYETIVTPGTCNDTSLSECGNYLDCKDNGDMDLRFRTGRAMIDCTNNEIKSVSIKEEQKVTCDKGTKDSDEEKDDEAKGGNRRKRDLEDTPPKNPSHAPAPSSALPPDEKDTTNKNSSQAAAGSDGEGGTSITKASKNTSPKEAGEEKPSTEKPKPDPLPTSKQASTAPKKAGDEESSSKKPDSGSLPPSKQTDSPLFSVDRDGQYSIILKLSPQSESDKMPTLKLAVETRDSRGGFLSAADFPFLYFYLVMTIVYVLFGFTWLLLLACYWRDLLRIQYYMGLVILLGLLEKVFYYSEYEHVDKNGETSKTMVIVAELVSKAKVTLMLALVVIISVGFGLVKPRLGPTLHKLLAVCAIYFVLASVEGCLRVTKMLQDVEKSESDLIALIPLTLMQVGIVYWVFSSLLQTIRTLRLRRNVSKLSLYRHFTNLLVLCMLASVGYLIWFMKEIRFTKCITDIREYWLNTGFWPMLFTVLLFVVMILWRPSINNQRYSHSLLLENEDDEEEDTLMMSEAFDAKKRSQANGGPQKERKSREEKVEDDLRWIEDNIPASVADSAINPVLNDSEEEIMTTRFELSKMD